ncbi:TPA: penicillin-binding protein 2 [bacterium]|nr:penicillin-binding protein 2 [bacterium]
MFDDEYRENLIRSKLRLIMTIIIIGFGILLLRLGHLQIIRNDYYVKKSNGNRLHPIRLIPPRGVIYDRDGKTPIVDNETAFDIYIAPDKKDYVWQTDKRRKMILDKLELTPQDITKKLSAGCNSKEPVLIKENVDSYIAAYIGENSIHVPEIIVRAKPIRKYAKIASHIIGYTAPVSEEDLSNGYAMNDVIGRSGLEAQYEDFLRGNLGWKMVEVNTFGQVVQELPLPDNIESGQNLYLTLDRKLQNKAEEIMQDKDGVLIALNPKDGGVLALVSKPDFDPHIFIGGRSAEDKIRVMKDPSKPMLNRAIMGEYPPGSTFKIISATAALAEGKITEDTYFTCRGSVYIGNRSFRCHKSGGHGTINIREALPKSCNVFFYNTAYRAGLTVPLIHKYADMYGLGKKTGIDLPGEKKGSVPSKSVYRTDNVNMVIGQGPILVTPIQMACVISAIANRGFAYKPHFIDYSRQPQNANSKEQNIYNDKPELLIDLRDKISPEVIELIRSSLINVAQHGMTAESKDLRKINTCGKTGTAQNPHGKPHAWYMGFAPYENPSIVVVALVENAGLGSENAAPVAGQLLSYYLFGEKTEDKISVAVNQ